MRTTIGAATTEIYTLSLHDALPIWAVVSEVMVGQHRSRPPDEHHPVRERKQHDRFERVEPSSDDANNDWSGDHRDLHSFPTRRSSDLGRRKRGDGRPTSKQAARRTSPRTRAQTARSVRP